MLGAIIGDIVGSKYEFSNIKSKDFPLFSEGCGYTDDTIMTVAVARAIMEAVRSYTPFGEELVWNMRRLGRRFPFPQGGYGGRFGQWLREKDPQPYHSFGNGAAMRVSPCGLYAVELCEALSMARTSAEVTHDHPEGIRGAQAVAGVIFLAKTGKSKEEIRNFVTANFYDLDFTLDEIRDSYRFDETCQGTVPQAIQAFLESDSFEDAIRNAVSLGGDCDTLTAITGSIAWTFYGKDGAQDPEDMRWIRREAELRIPLELLETVREFQNICMARMDGYHKNGFVKPFSTGIGPSWYRESPKCIGGKPLRERLAEVGQDDLTLLFASSESYQKILSEHQLGILDYKEHMQVVSDIEKDPLSLQNESVEGCFIYLTYLWRADYMSGGYPGFEEAHRNESRLARVRLLEQNFGILGYSMRNAPVCINMPVTWMVSERRRKERDRIDAAEADGAYVPGPPEELRPRNGCIYRTRSYPIGAAIGDIVGSKYEFDNIKTKEFPLFSPGCGYTDDTIMTVAVAKALMRSRDEMLPFRDVLIREMQTLGQRFPFPQGGYGNRFGQWLREKDPQPYHSFGNGSAMRVSPCGLYAMELSEALHLARASAEVTHDHPEGIRGAQAVAGAIFLAKEKKTKEEIRDFIIANFYDLDFTLEEIRNSYRFNETCQGTVPQAIQAFLESESFEDAIRNAVSLGGDCDTLTAITGSIAWPFYAARAYAADSKKLNEISTEAEKLLPEDFVETIQLFHEKAYTRCETHISKGGGRPVPVRIRAAREELYFLRPQRPVSVDGRFLEEAWMRSDWDEIGKLLASAEHYGKLLTKHGLGVWNFGFYWDLCGQLEKEPERIWNATLEDCLVYLSYLYLMSGGRTAFDHRHRNEIRAARVRILELMCNY